MSKVKKCENYSCHRISGAGKVRTMHNTYIKSYSVTTGQCRRHFAVYGEANAIALESGNPVRFHYSDGTTLDQI